MKKTTSKRLTLDRETVKTLGVELSSGQLGAANGAASVFTTTTVPIATQAQTQCFPCNSTFPRCGGCSSGNTSTLIG
jgi:hypothetical protein